MQYKIGLHDSQGLQAALDVGNRVGVFTKHGQECDRPQSLDELPLHLSRESAILIGRRKREYRHERASYRRCLTVGLLFLKPACT